MFFKIDSNQTLTITKTRNVFQNRLKSNTQQYTTQIMVVKIGSDQTQTNTNTCNILKHRLTSNTSKYKNSMFFKLDSNQIQKIQNHV